MSVWWLKYVAEKKQPPESTLTRMYEKKLQIFGNLEMGSNLSLNFQKRGLQSFFSDIQTPNLVLSIIKINGSIDFKSLFFIFLAATKAFFIFLKK